MNNSNKSIENDDPSVLRSQSSKNINKIKIRVNNKATNDLKAMLNINSNNSR